MAGAVLPARRLAADPSTMLRSSTGPQHPNLVMREWGSTMTERGDYELKVKRLDLDALEVEYRAGRRPLRRARRLLVSRWIETDEARRHAQVMATLRMHGRLPG